MKYVRYDLDAYERDTRHLSMLEHGAYHLLLDAYYRTEKPLPLDEKELFRLVRCKNAAEKQIAILIMRYYFTKTEKGWTHKRCEMEIERHKSKKNKALEAAKARWSGSANGAKRPSEGYANALQTQCERIKNAAPRNGSSEPRKINGTSPKNTPSGQELLFDLPVEAPAEEAKPAPTQTKGTRLTVTELPVEWRLACRTLRPELDPDEVFESFRDYWCAQPGARGVKLDWEATWRNWCRREPPLPRHAGGRQAALERHNRSMADEFGG